MVVPGLWVTFQKAHADHTLWGSSGKSLGLYHWRSDFEGERGWGLQQPAVGSCQIEFLVTVVRK